MLRFPLALTLTAFLTACPEDTLVEAPTDGPGPGQTTADSGVVVSVPDAGMEVRVTAPVDEPVVHVEDPRRGAPYPLVLVHGLNGFRDIGPLDYFFRVPGALEEAGHQVFVTAVAPYGSSEHRAELLAPQIDAILESTGARKVNIIAHSQGGLDSRYLISTLGYGDRVASLTTVSTPHRGSGVADVVLGGEDIPGFETVANAYAALFGLVASDAENDPDARAALHTLSAEGCEVFNAHNLDDPRVKYFSWAGRSNLQRADDECAGEDANPSAVDAVAVELLGSWTVVADDILHPIPNDGLVSVPSAKWGRFMGCVPADHLDEIGQVADLVPDVISGWDHVGFYVDWANRLRAMGL